MVVGASVGTGTLAGVAVRAGATLATDVRLDGAGARARAGSSIFPPSDGATDATAKAEAARKKNARLIAASLLGAGLVDGS